MPTKTKETMGPGLETIYVVDDDANVRESLLELLESVGHHALAFESAPAFLRHERTDSGACMVLDLQMPDISGLELQKRLSDQNSMPIIFISGHGDVPSTVQAMKAGAIEFLTKPIHEPSLLEAIRLALTRDQRIRQRNGDLALLQARLESLTPREREVFVFMLSGLLNKQTASVLGISEVTVQAHRGQVMRKMSAGSFAELIRMAGRLGLKAKATEAFSVVVSDEGSRRG